MSWLNNILLQHEEFESPRNFVFWAALASISAVVKDNIWLNKYLYNLYPNIYVMLHADSGLKKGPPISMAKQLVREVNNTRIISGRSSIQGILKKLGTAETRPGGHIINNSCAFICSSELSSSIVDDPAANAILTDLYDRNYNTGEWESLLKMESFTLKNATVSMLTGTNEAHNDEMFQRRDIQGGYFARTFIIYEKEIQKINSLMFAPVNLPDYKASAVYLKELAKLKGELTLDNDTRKYFDDWYRGFKGALISQKVKDNTGTLNRFDDSVLKVAILISLATEPSLIITLDSVKTAITECEKLVGNVRHATMGTGKSVWAQEKSLAIQELVNRSNHIITRAQLNNKYWMRANANEWDEIMHSLEVAGMILIETAGNQIVYRMKNEIVEEWVKHFKGK